MKLVLSVCTLVVLLFVACGGDDDGASPSPSGEQSVTASPSPSPTPVPTLPVLEPGDPTSLPSVTSPTPAGSAVPVSPVQLLDAATYRTNTFAPVITFTIADGWSIVSESEHSLSLSRRPEPDNIALTFDSANPEDIDVAVSRFTSITGTSAGDVTETIIAGYPAREFDVTNESIITPINGLDQPYAILEDDRLHFWLVDVNGALVKVIAEAPAGDFDYYVALARETIVTLLFD